MFRSKTSFADAYRLPKSSVWPSVAIFNDVGAAAKLWLNVADTGADGLHVRQILHGLRIFKRQLFADPQFLGRRPEGNAGGRQKMFDPMLLIMLLTLSFNPRTSTKCR